MQHFLNLADLSNERVSQLVARAIELKAGGTSDAGLRKTLGLVFLNPSLRTRVSMVGAWGLMGGTSVDLTPGQGMWNLATGTEPMDKDAAEHIEEAAGVLGRLCHVLGVRAFAEGKRWEEDRKDALMAAFAEFSDAPLINMESSLYHPCQALADRQTLDELSVPANGRFVLSWANHPKALPMAVPNSALLMAAQRGMQVTILRPEGYDLDAQVMQQAGNLAQAAGGSIDCTDDAEVLRNAHVVYAKSWGSIAYYGRKDDELAYRATLPDWCVGRGRMEVPSAYLMHCLPVRRDVVVSRELLTGPQSVILQEAENRKWAQAAVLEAMAGD